MDRPETALLCSVYEALARIMSSAFEASPASIGWFRRGLRPRRKTRSFPRGRNCTLLSILSPPARRLGRAKTPRSNVDFGLAIASYGKSTGFPFFSSRSMFFTRNRQKRRCFLMSLPRARSCPAVQRYCLSCAGSKHFDSIPHNCRFCTWRYTAKAEELCQRAITALDRPDKNPTGASAAATGGGGVGGKASAGGAKGTILLIPGCYFVVVVVDVVVADSILLFLVLHGRYPIPQGDEKSAVKNSHETDARLKVDTLKTVSSVRENFCRRMPLAQRVNEPPSSLVHVCCKPWASMVSKRAVEAHKCGTHISLPWRQRLQRDLFQLVPREREEMARGWRALSLVDHRVAMTKSTDITTPK